MAFLQDVIIKETATMHDQRHPNVLPLFCSFVYGDSLWMVMPFLSGGSVMRLLYQVAPEVMRLPPVTTRMPPCVSCPAGLYSSFLRSNALLRRKHTHLLLLTVRCADCRGNCTLSVRSTVHIVNSW